MPSRNLHDKTDIGLDLIIVHDYATHESRGLVDIAYNQFTKLQERAYTQTQELVVPLRIYQLSDAIEAVDGSSDYVHAFLIDLSEVELVGALASEQFKLGSENVHLHYVSPLISKGHEDALPLLFSSLERVFDRADLEATDGLGTHRRALRDLGYRRLATPLWVPPMNASAPAHYKVEIPTSFYVQSMHDELSEEQARELIDKYLFEGYDAKEDTPSVTRTREALRLPDNRRLLPIR